MTGLAKGSFRLALRLFPRWFRTEYGEDMGRDFARGLDAAGRRLGGWGRAAYTTRALLAIPLAAARAHVGGAGAFAPEPLVRASGWSDDLRDAVRSLVRTPSWTAAALLILSLGIGGSTAVFSVLDAVLLRPLPFENPDALVSLWTANEVQNLPDGSSWENATDWVARGRALEEIAFVLRPEFSSATVTSFGEPERIHVGIVSAAFFSMLGVDAVAGRTFAEEDVEADSRIAVISEELWSARYGSDPSVLGRSLTIDGEEVRIVGVAPSRLAIPRRETRIWTLVDPKPTGDRTRRNLDAWWILGRLAPGISLDEAQVELSGIAEQLAVEYPDTNRDLGVSIRSLRSEIVGDRLPLLLWTLFGSMMVVLVIGGTNVAQLLLSRGLVRERELAVRAALGASRTRLLRQLALEGLLLGLAAGVTGVVLAAAGLRGLLSLVPPDIPLTEGVHIDGAVLTLALLTSALLAPLIGLLPALRASRTDVAGTLRSGSRGSAGRDQGLRAALVVAEVAMAVILLSGAGLLVRSAIALQAVDPGFDDGHVLVARLDLDGPDDTDWVLAQSGIQERLGHVPGVLGVGLVESLFITRNPDQTITLVGDAPRDPAEPAPRLMTDFAMPGLFPALGVPLLRGRGLEPADLPLRPQVVVVNQAWVDAFAEGRDPIGLQFRWGQRVQGDALTVVGVVGDVRRTSLEDETFPQIFIPGAWRSVDVLVRTEGDPLAVAGAVRDAIREIQPGAALSGVGRATDRYAVGLAPRRFQTLLFEIFAGLATVLAAMGLFAVLHEGVSARRREIGIRLALGAAPASVRVMVLRHGVGLTVAGAAIGLLVTAALSSITARMVYGVGGADPLTLASVTALVIVVALVAAGAPALRATRVAPSETLTGD